VERNDSPDPVRRPKEETRDQPKQEGVREVYFYLGKKKNDGKRDPTSAGRTGGEVTGLRIRAFEQEEGGDALWGGFSARQLGRLHVVGKELSIRRQKPRKLTAMHLH